MVVWCVRVCPQTRPGTGTIEEKKNNYISLPAYLKSVRKHHLTISHVTFWGKSLIDVM